ncbi:trissin receptor-like [Cylas formicarius]|uniref:trissin receptor-like n=1 Tax=Cylas formicarius TaxID=197179 RepID=UPI002958D2E4|nr:trissin receptor-like [Cylas formicarius]XP_060521237.1 trissin receptor-like [Cylas formicarius]
MLHRDQSTMSDGISYYVTRNPNSDTNWTTQNSSTSDGTFFLSDADYIFDKFYVRIIFISLYSIVFALCFFGNLLVILVVTMSRRLRSITNFFLANLAVADFCVAIFCVYQNLFIYIVDNWLLGNFLCKMYMFIQSLSNTASIFILVVICTERYFAILYPITCKQILTSIRLKLIILGVWSICILYSLPKFFWGNAITIGTKDSSETVCVLDRQRYNSEIFDMVHFVLFYILPLGVMSLLYAKIAVCLWNSSQQLKKQLDASITFGQHQGICRMHSSGRRRNDKAGTANGSSSFGAASKQHLQLQNLGGSFHAASSPSPTCSEHVLKARKGVIRMLIFVVAAFAVCNLPIHARKMWQYWSSNYHGGTNFSAILTPLTFLASYFNSGANPLLYAFLSKNFRRGMREMLFCPLTRNNRGLSMSVRQQRSVRNTAGVFHRQSSTRSTMKGQNATTVTVVHECSSDEL